MMKSTSANDIGFVSVDIPSNHGNNNDNDAPESSSILTDIENSDNNGTRQRSLLKTLWSEATSTTDLPPNNLHHRRGNNSNTMPRKDNSNNGGTTTGNISPSSSKRRAAGSLRHHHGKQRLARGAKIAKRVWLAAFAAFGASLLIALHVFIYKTFHSDSNSSTTDQHDNYNNNNNNNNAKNNNNRMALVSKSAYQAAIDKNNLGIEDRDAKMTLDEARSHQLKPIAQHPIDTSQYTIRINTWQRNEQLLLSINHHSQCEGVKEIQIIWCDSQNDPPAEIVHHRSGKVKVERHSVNSLNERFKVMIDPPTLGVLSLDDDVLRPCDALDAAFIRWTRNPERMVGFDVRTHVVEETMEGGNVNVGNTENTNNNNNNNNNVDKVGGSTTTTNWKYGYLSTTEKSNRYSLTLPRASFLHRDYLDLYTLALPRDLYVFIAQNFECEDIAMSFFVSSMTGGKPPLIADYWAVKSMVKLYSEAKISGGKDHKARRDECVDSFAEVLGVKERGDYPLRTGKVKHSKKSYFGYGDSPEDWENVDPRSFSSTRLQEFVKEMQRRSKEASKDGMMTWLVDMKRKVMAEAKSAGMIEKTDEWTKRWVEIGSGDEN